jgi:transketolase
MRKELSRALLAIADDPKMLFLTGDLGFMAFEDLEKKLGKRFINMGISEQNMISVAASLAHDGFRPYVYSIAPFVIARPFEQIRNELGLHNLPVTLIGNGGGYGYGIMGSTHHILEDIALMRSVQNMKIYLPVYNNDIDTLIPLVHAQRSPAFIRMNNSIARDTAPLFGGVRQHVQGKKGVIVGVGPVLLNACKAAQAAGLDVSAWSVDSLPLTGLPQELLQEIQHSARVLTIEEHQQAGGLGELMSGLLMQSGYASSLSFRSLYAHGYISGNYGDQHWHQEENGLAGNSLTETLSNFFS